MNGMNNKRNFDLYGSMSKILRDALDSLNIYDDCIVMLFGIKIVHTSYLWKFLL